MGMPTETLLGMKTRRKGVRGNKKKELWSLEIPATAARKRRWAS
jgi:hypothetical protein